MIVTFGRLDVTERCLASLDTAFGSRLGSDVELVLVDNGSPDDTPEALSSWGDRAIVVLLGENRNYAGGNNVGVQRATGEIVVLLNNDTEVPAGALDALADEARRPGVAISGCRLLYPDGRIQHGGCAWWKDPDGRVLPFHLFQYAPGELPAACASFDCDVVTGACLAIRRDLFLELGGFDEGYVNGLEDVDLCVRARVAGHRVRYRGDIALVHAEGATRSRHPDDIRNQERFCERYGHITQDDSARLAAQFGASGPTFGVSVHPGDTPWGSIVSVEGNVFGLGSDAAESRALLAALDRAGLSPATRDWQPVLLMPLLTGREGVPALDARKRAKRRDAMIVQTPTGSLGPVEVHERAILRLAHVPAFDDVSRAAAAWVPSAALAEQLRALGVNERRIAVLPPALPEVPLGSGGAGILAILPAHDPALCAELLSALAQAASGIRTRLVPTVLTECMTQLAANLLPEADLIAPVSSEAMFAKLAGECDVAVCVDPSDAYERRALLAAAAGTPAVHLPAGTAAELLGGELAFDGSPATIDAALAAPHDRAARARGISAACSERALAPQLRALVQQAWSELPPTRSELIVRQLAAESRSAA